MSVRLLATRKGTCRCKHPLVIQLLATDVEDATPIEVACCEYCDGPGPWAPQRELE